MVNGILITLQGKVTEIAEPFTLANIHDVIGTNEFTTSAFPHGLTVYISDEDYSGQTVNALGNMVAYSLTSDTEFTNQDNFYGSILFRNSATDEEVAVPLTEEQLLNLRGEICDAARFLNLSEEELYQMWKDL